MKKNIFRSLIFSVIMLLTVNVNAAYISADEIDDNSYVIGKYLFTRATNTEKNYNGELTTKVMLLAAKSIDGELDDMKVYYKTFLGDWIDGITGESITPPSYFEIDNRNLKDIFPTPYLTCEYEYLEQPGLNCYASIHPDKFADPDKASSLNIANFYSGTYNGCVSCNADSNKNWGAEFYIVKNKNGTYPDSLVDSYSINQSSSYNLELLDVDTDYNWSSSQFYQVVSRFYYDETQLDGTTKKVYSNYSNVSSNGAKVKLGIDLEGYTPCSGTCVSLLATKNDNFEIKAKDTMGYLDGDSIYYDVVFRLSGVDTTQYLVRDYKVYSSLRIFDNISSRLNNNNIEGGSPSALSYYLNRSVDDRYMYGKLISRKNYYPMYLVAEVNGQNAYGKWNNVSDEQAYSKLIVDEDMDDKGIYRAIVNICNKEQTMCFDVISSTYLTTHW